MRFLLRVSFFRLFGLLKKGILPFRKKIKQQVEMDLIQVLI
ncbi:hypothetical protein X474_15320 [Dethiosulfatarculus sandiegensis]|uniref:Uncharacterized protein n=1 Tax=Dethiosulfatarculus sandiegensis TaxID=1429043 RepID=A0A0D2J4T4_9BACT|nr:hypothetical protein X474_15320 [Dethiosulfatarculus sandiegensis]